MSDTTKKATTQAPAAKTQAPATTTQAPAAMDSEKMAAMMLEIMGVKEPNKALTAESYARAIITESQARTAANSALAKGIVREVEHGHELMLSNMKLTKACYDKTSESLKRLEAANKPLAPWAWIIPILVFILSIAASIKLDPLNRILLGIVASGATFLITFVIDQYGKR